MTYANSLCGCGDPRRGFKKFLTMAENHPTMLPPRWSVEKRRACARSSTKGWSNMTCAMEKSDIMEHYKDNSMPMQLRMVGQQIYGKSLFRQDAAPVRALLRAQFETGGKVAYMSW